MSWNPHDNLQNEAQLELPVFSRGRLAECLRWSLNNRADQLRPETIVKDYDARIEWLLKVFGDCPLSELTFEHINHIGKKYGIRMGDDGLANSTINKRFVFLRRALAEAHARGIIPAVPLFPKFKDDSRPGQDWLNPVQFKALMEHIPGRWKTWMMLAWGTGSRRGDLNSFRWSWVDLKTPFTDHLGKEISPGRWLRHTSKTDPEGRRAAWLPLELDLWEWLDRIPKGAPHERLGGHWIRSNQVIARACQLSGVPHVTPSGFRRSLVARLLTRGLSEEACRLWLGHISHEAIHDTKALMGERRGPKRHALISRHYMVAAPDLFAAVNNK